MIQLSRVRLINWHNFVDDTLTFEKITYLIGVNAVGKTTILDAIRYCLTTNKDFNRYLINPYLIFLFLISQSFVYLYLIALDFPT